MEYNRHMTDDKNQKSGGTISKKKSKFCNYNNCNKAAIYNYESMKPKFCFDHKYKGMVNIRKKHTSCEKHDISHSPKIVCPKCKIKKSTKCECYITASCNFEKLKPLKCLKHRKTGMINIKRKRIL